MRALELAGPGAKLSVLCIGAHADDIEIGVGGTIWNGSPPVSSLRPIGAF